MLLYAYYLLQVVSEQHSYDTDVLFKGAHNWHLVIFTKVGEENLSEDFRELLQKLTLNEKDHTKTVGALIPFRTGYLFLEMFMEYI